MRTEQIRVSKLLSTSIWAMLLAIGLPGFGQERMVDINREMPPPLELDRERIAANGIGIYESNHLRLVTDVRDEEQRREMMAVFDAAVDEWCAYFDIAPSKARVWKINCICLLNPDSLDRFRAARLLPDHVPPFPAGYNRGHEIWMYVQPTRYYNRHLLLHEGTHSFMQWFLRGSGPPWYSEGMAELVAVHRWAGGELSLGVQRFTRQETEAWRRPEIVQQAVGRGDRLTLKEVMDFPNRAFLDVNYYGWAWAACQF